MKVFFLNLIDGFCTLIWTLFVALNKVLEFILLVIGKLISAVWSGLSKVLPLSKISREINKFFKSLHSILNPIFSKLAKYYDIFLSNTSKSIVMKRIFVPILMVLLFLTVYPPSHWGYGKLREQGIASYYGYGFYFRQTASGERYWPWNFSAASLTLPLGTIAKVVNRTNGRSVYVVINDRGPYVSGRILDLSFAAAIKLGMIHYGLVPVDIYTKSK